VTGRDRPDTSVVRHEEELLVQAKAVDAGSLVIRKEVDAERVTERIDRSAEQFDGVDRVTPNDRDSGEIETLADGSISIPILEEQIVVTKRLVVRERVIVRKATITEPQVVEAELRRERVEIDGPEGLVHEEPRPADGDATPEERRSGRPT
jgi:uncharacterized protein (TIGR02271 family)